MAEIESENDSAKKKDVASEASDKERESTASLSSDIWKGKEISRLTEVTRSNSEFDLKVAGFAAITLTRLDAGASSSRHSNGAEKTEKVGNAAEQSEQREETENQKDPKSDLEKRYGVEVREKDGRYEYVLKANGKETVLADSDKSVEGLREAEQKLKDAAEAKMKELEEKYGIKITREGQEVTGFGHGEERDKAYHGRTPTFRELTALEEALRRSGDTHVTKDPSKPLEVTFVQEESFAFGFYNPDSNQLFMFTTHGDRDKIPPTPEDREKERTASEPPDLRHIILHELSHHSQTTFAPDDKTLEKEYKDMGWVESKDKEEDGKPKYEYLNKDGYQYEQRITKDGPQWYRKNSDGDYIDKDGNKVDSFEKAHALSYNEMREQALVPPASDYFFHPVEQQADNLTLLRTGDDVRGKFLRDNYDLYVSTKATDQRHIDSVYGKNSDGSSKMIRMPDGTIAENNQRNRDNVSDFEKHWRK